MRGALRRSRLARAAVRFVIPAPQPVACGPRRDSALPSPTAVPPRPGVAAPIGGSRQRVVSTSRGWSASAVAFVAAVAHRCALRSALRANVTSKLLLSDGSEPLRYPIRRCTDASSRHNDSCPQFRIRFDIHARRAIADRPIRPRPRRRGPARGPQHPAPAVGHSAHRHRSPSEPTSAWLLLASLACISPDVLQAGPERHTHVQHAPARPGGRGPGHLTARRAARCNWLCES